MDLRTVEVAVNGFLPVPERQQELPCLRGINFTAMLPTISPHPRAPALAKFKNVPIEELVLGRSNKLVEVPPSAAQTLLALTFSLLTTKLSKHVITRRLPGALHMTVQLEQTLQAR